MILKAFTFLMPWRLKRWALQHWFGFRLDPAAHIGFSWIFPSKLVMESGAKIGHFTFAVNLDLIEMKKDSGIGRGNWITGFPTKTDSLHFKHQLARRAELYLGESANITKNHHIDCTDRIEIGRFATVAGYRSQFLTHSVDLYENRQDSSPIIIGEYSFVATDVIVLGGAILPPRSALVAKSLLNKPYTEEWRLYGGVPAKVINEISKNAKYFTRTEGYIY
jgi:acetyltransferase-like isoleucine patch superfamily enzyme